MVGRRERRGPEAHERVADIFVDGRARLEEDIGHRSQEAVEKRGDLLRVHVLRERGEAADIAEQDGDLARFAAERQRLGILRQPFHHRRRQIL